MSGIQSLSPRQQILTVAVELLAERGRAGASLRELAGRVGIHNSTLFHYFPDKGSLVASALDAVAERQLEWLERLEADEPPSLAALESVLADWDRHLCGAPAEASLLWDALGGPGASSGDDRPASVPVGRLTSLLEGWLERAAAAGLIRCPQTAAATGWILGAMLFRPHAGVDGEPGAGRAAAPSERPLARFVASGLGAREA
ncbi:MAG: TetR/AcrR family transcriptional regulator [Myxococcota bacterium]